MKHTLKRYTAAWHEAAVPPEKCYCCDGYFKKEYYKLEHGSYQGGTITTSMEEPTLWFCSMECLVNYLAKKC
jgi:hypothetical protein